MQKLLINENMGDYEKEHKRASYKTLVEYFIGDIVLCNNIVNIDETVFENMNIEPRYYNENGEEITEDEYLNDDNAYCDDGIPEIYQYYLCNVSQYNAEFLEKAGVILSYSDKLDCDVLCVDHYGTNWGYVLTSVELVDKYEDL